MLKPLPLIILSFNVKPPEITLMPVPFKLMLQLVIFGELPLTKIVLFMSQLLMSGEQRINKIIEFKTVFSTMQP
jgi:hypothetical protein